MEFVGWVPDRRTAGYFASFGLDDSRLITRTQVGKAYIWDANDGSKVATLLEAAYDVQSAGFYPKGRAITTSSGWSIEVWDAKSGRKLKTIPANVPTTPEGIHANADGGRIITISRSDPARADVWNTDDGTWIGMSEIPRQQLKAGDISFRNDAPVALEHIRFRRNILH